MRIPMAVTRDRSLKGGRCTLKEKESMPTFFQPQVQASSELGAFIYMFSFNLHNGFEKLYFNTLALQGRKLRLRKMMSSAGIH